MNTYIGFAIGSVFLGILQIGFQPPKDKVVDSEYKKELRHMLSVCKDTDCETIERVLARAK